MAIYRIHKEDNFVIIDKAFLLNEEISLKAKGLLALLLSYPDNWQFYKAEIVQHTTDKENSLNSGLKELIENGYIVRKQRKDKNGKFNGKTVNGKTIDGKTVNGKTIDGKTIDGKTDTTK